MRVKMNIVFLLILSTTLPVVAQDESAEEPVPVTEEKEEVRYVDVDVPRKMAVFFNAEGNLTAAEELLLSESLLIKLAEDKDVVVLEPVFDDKISAAERSSRTSSGGGDCWLLISLQADNERILIKAESFDIYGEKTVFDGLQMEKTRNLRRVNRRFWQEILDAVSEGYNVIVERKKYTENLHVIATEEKTVVEKGVDVTFIAAPGTVIQGVGEKPLIVGPEGRLTTDLLGYSTYDLRATCRGFYPVKERIYLETEAREIVLEQMPASRWGFDLYLQNIDYIGLGVFYYILSNSWFVELSATFYQQKLIWVVEPGERDLYNLPLTHLFLSTGYYFNAPDSLFRLYGSLGAMLRLTYLDQAGITPDPLSPWGLKASLNCELPTHLKLKLFVEYSCLMYFTGDGLMMKAALAGVDDSSDLLAGYLFTDNMVFDLLHFKLGGRLQLP